MMGAEALLPLAQLEERHYRALMREGTISGGMVDEEFRRMSRERMANQGRINALNQEWETAKERVGMRVGNWVDEHLRLPAISRMNDRLGIRREPPPTASEKKDTAAERLANSMDALRHEFVNGRGQARNAVPKRLGGEAWKRIGIPSRSRSEPLTCERRLTETGVSRG